MSLYNKINNKEANIGVIGLGYVGLPLAIEFAKAGFNVSGIDVDDKKIAAINKGNNYISDIDDSLLMDLVKKGKLKATKNTSIITTLDAISICVPTPLSKVNEPDVSYIVNSVNAIKRYLHKDLLIVLESTTYPGTTKEVVLSALRKSGLIVGEDYYLCFSPERIDPGNENYNISNTPKVIGGVTIECAKVGQLLYSQIVKDVISVSSPETAEMVKLLENTFRSINIGLANEVAIMCEKLGIDVWEVIDAASTKPYGFMKFTPGPGLGGHCIPIDPLYLSWKMKNLNYNPKFIDLASEINASMPEHILDTLKKALNTNQKELENSKILLLGMAYKKDIDDIRESPSLDILYLLNKNNSKVEYFDPYIPDFVFYERKYKSLGDLNSEVLKKFDAVIILTDHSNIDYELIKNNAALIIDTRNVYPLNNDNNIYRLGVGKSE
ncbi:MAG: nucleotide sugar dehydrogenase [Candidatus Neomarinimicrobiota bacterium]|nr:nucleotide sugar dehydrogenase [Candidatus Neomarinimicrobiota bacterium]